MNFSVPEDDVHAIEQLSKLPISELRKLFDVLSTAPKSLDIGKWIDSKTTDLADRLELDRNTISNLILSLCAAKDFDATLPEAKFIEAVVDQIVEEADEEVDREAIQTIVVNLTSVPAVRASSSALNAAYNHQKCLFTAEIVSDLRAVFDKDILEGALVVHTLVLGYGEGRQSKTAYFAMDEKDLEVLEAAVSSARLKEKSLLAVAEAAKLSIIGPSNRD
jgi:hypothetical protein